MESNVKQRVPQGKKTPWEERECECMGGGEEIGIKRKTKRVSRFSYWAVALSLSPHPRISMTTPLLLHSGKKDKKRSEFYSAAEFSTGGKMDSYFFKAHGTEFVYFACVLRTGDGSACIDVRPKPRCLFEHLWVLLVLCDKQTGKTTVSLCERGFSILTVKKLKNIQSTYVPTSRTVVTHL